MGFANAFEQRLLGQFFSLSLWLNCLPESCEVRMVKEQPYMKMEKQNTQARLLQETPLSGQKVSSSFFIGPATSGVPCHVHIKMDGLWQKDQLWSTSTTTQTKITFLLNMRKVLTLQFSQVNKFCQASSLGWQHQGSCVMYHVHLKMDGVWLDNQFCHLPQCYCRHNICGLLVKAK